MSRGVGEVGWNIGRGDIVFNVTRHLDLIKCAEQINNKSSSFEECSSGPGFGGGWGAGSVGWSIGGWVGGGIMQSL